MFKENYIYNWRTQIYYIQMREQRQKEIREGRVIFEMPLLYTDSAAFSKREYLMEMRGKLKRSGPRRLAAREMSTRILILADSLYCLTLSVRIESGTILCCYANARALYSHLRMGNQLAQRSVLFQVSVGKKKSYFVLEMLKLCYFKYCSDKFRQGTISASWFAKLAYVKKHCTTILLLFRMR